MKKNENIKTLAEKYKEIFQKEVYDFNRGGPVDRHLVGFLIEFAGAVEHHLSSEQPLKTGGLKEVSYTGSEKHPQRFVVWETTAAKSPTA